MGRLLHPVVAAGGVRLINCFGTGVADDKLAHAYVPDMIRFYLDEEPLLPQVETFDLGEPRTLERALDVFDELGDQGPRLLRRASASSSARTPSAPTWRSCASRCAPRRATTSRSGSSGSPRTRPRFTEDWPPGTWTCDPIVLMCELDDVEVLPGGITRVALDEGALVVNSSQNGGAKDTWVVP